MSFSQLQFQFAGTFLSLYLTRLAHGGETIVDPLAFSPCFIIFVFLTFCFTLLNAKQKLLYSPQALPRPVLLGSYRSPLVLSHYVTLFFPLFVFPSVLALLFATVPTPLIHFYSSPFSFLCIPSFLSSVFPVLGLSSQRVFPPASLFPFGFGAVWWATSLLCLLLQILLLL